MTRSRYRGQNRSYFSGHHCCFTVIKSDRKLTNHAIESVTIHFDCMQSCQCFQLFKIWQGLESFGYAPVKEAQIRLLLSPCWDWVNLSCDARLCCQLLQGTMAICTSSAGVHREFPLHWHLNINFQGRTTNAFQMLCYGSRSSPRPNWITKWNATDRARLSEKKT